LYFSLVSGTLACVTVTAARKLRLSPKRRAQLKLQGRYIGYIRQLRPRQKAEVRRIQKRMGVEKAIRKAKELVS